MRLILETTIAPAHTIAMLVRSIDSDSQTYPDPIHDSPMRGGMANTDAPGRYWYSLRHADLYSQTD